LRRDGVEPGSGDHASGFGADRPEHDPDRYPRHSPSRSFDPPGRRRKARLPRPHSRNARRHPSLPPNPPERPGVAILRHGPFRLGPRPDDDNPSSAARAATEPSPAFQSRGSSHIVVSVAAATVEADQQVQPSLPRLSADALMVPALKSRARFMWSLPRPRRRLPSRSPHWPSL